MEERPRTVYVETGIGMAYDSGCAVWPFDPDLWGSCAQGLTVDDAISTFAHLHGPATIVETIHGDEQAFVRDHELATDEELALTLDILAEQRARAFDLLAHTPSTQLDVEDPDRDLPPLGNLAFHPGHVLAHL